MENQCLTGIDRQKDYLHQLITRKSKQTDNVCNIPKNVFKLPSHQVKTDIKTIDSDFLFDNFESLILVKTIQIEKQLPPSLKQDLNFEFQKIQQTVQKKSSVYLTNKFLQEQQTKNKFTQNIFQQHKKRRALSFQQAKQNSFEQISIPNVERPPKSYYNPLDHFRRKQDNDIVKKSKKNNSVQLQNSFKDKSINNKSTNKDKSFNKSINNKSINKEKSVNKVPNQLPTKIQISSRQQSQTNLQIQKKLSIKQYIEQNKVKKAESKPKQTGYLEIKKQLTKKIEAKSKSKERNLSNHNQKPTKQLQNQPQSKPYVPYQSSYQKILQKQRERSLSSKGNQVVLGKTSEEKQKNKQMQNAHIMKNRFGDFIDLLIQ